MRIRLYDSESNSILVKVIDVNILDLLNLYSPVLAAITCHKISHRTGKLAGIATRPPL